MPAAAPGVAGVGFFNGLTCSATYSGVCLFLGGTAAYDMTYRIHDEGSIYSPIPCDKGFASDRLAE